MILFICIFYHFNIEILEHSLEECVEHPTGFPKAPGSNPSSGHFSLQRTSGPPAVTEVNNHSWPKENNNWLRKINPATQRITVTQHHTRTITTITTTSEFNPLSRSPNFFKDVSFHVSFHVKFGNMGWRDFRINNPQNSCLVMWLLTWNITFWVKYSIRKLGDCMPNEF